MALHQSLVELSGQAARLTNLATAKGVLLEAQDLTRNALLHSEDEPLLAAWYSQLVSDVIHSPALKPLAKDIILTGSVAVGDATPTCTVTWRGQSPALEEFLTSLGISSACVPDSLAAKIDSGETPDPLPTSELLDEALSLRPPALQLRNGLPDPEQQVDIKAFLLVPIQTLARWADPAPISTLDRLAVGLESRRMTPEEADSLTLAWRTGLALDFRAWLAGMSGSELVFGDLPALDRTAYGAACRMVAQAIDSLRSRH